MSRRGLKALGKVVEGGGRGGGEACDRYRLSDSVWCREVGKMCWMTVVGAPEYVLVRQRYFTSSFYRRVLNWLWTSGDSFWLH